MSEIKRTNEVERYNTTVDWLQDFINKVAKNAPPAPPSVSIASREKFATIEDKMQDIKARVGFNSLNKLSNNSDKKVITSSEKCTCGKKDGECTCKKCTCGKKDGKCTCKKKSKVEKKTLDTLRNVLKYISDMIASEPHLLEPEIRSRCIENKDLGFETLNLNPEKIKAFVEKKKGNKDGVTAEVIYMKPGSNRPTSEEDIADYFRHGLPPSR
jgi:hypothetical protein